VRQGVWWAKEIILGRIRHLKPRKAAFLLATYFANDKPGNYGIFMVIKIKNYNQKYHQNDKRLLNMYFYSQNAYKLILINSISINSFFHFVCIELTNLKFL
jgi:hypothetical protein